MKLFAFQQHSARRILTSRSFSIIIVALGTACSEAPVSPRVPVAEIARPNTLQSPDSAFDRLLVGLDRELTSSERGRSMSGFSVVDGATHRYRSATEGRAAFSAALRERGVPPDSRTRQSPTTFGIPYDGDADVLRMILPASTVIRNGSKFEFMSSTIINKFDMADFTHDGLRRVSYVSSGGPIEIWSLAESVNFKASNGIGTNAWPSFNTSNGCHFLGTLSTNHKVSWPAGGYNPVFATKRVYGASGGANEITQNCTPASPLPPPPPSNPLCDDPDGYGCTSTGTGGSGPYAGGPIVRELGRSGGYKTVCIVTDWYENGTFVETTVDRCWSEPIY